VTEAFGTKVSVGPPYFNPVSAIFVFPMLVIMAAGPMMRWRADNGRKLANMMAVPALVAAAALALAVVFGGEIGVLPLLGLALAAGLAIASVLPLWKRNLRRTPAHVWGMVIAHLGIAVALAGMASERAFNTEKLVASELGQSHSVGPWTIELQGIRPVAGPNWTALEARLVARYGDSSVQTVLTPQSRMFASPPTATNEAALLTRWNGQLYVVLGEEGEDGRWQLRLWWKPFVPLIWYGGLLIGLGGVLALVGRTVRDLRRKDQPEPEPAAVPAKGGRQAGGQEALA
jgi:cytochrome c-type biogenesis protein CcmF